MSTRGVDWGTVEHYRDRSDSFLQGVQTLDVDPDGYGNYGNAVALLAVHSSISLTDALFVAQAEERSRDGDHRIAADKLRKLCSMNGLDGGGVKHFIWLIQHKTPIAYGDDPIDDNKVKLAREKALQFHAWVYRTFPELARAKGGEPS